MQPWFNVLIGKWLEMEEEAKVKVKVNIEVKKCAFIHMAHPLKCLLVVEFNPFDCVM